MSKANDPVVISFRQSVGARLIEARKAAGMTQVSASRAAGLMTQASLSNYENGKRDIPLRTLVALAQTYRTPLDSFVGDSGD